MITFTLPTPKDFDFQATVLSHGWYQLAPNLYDSERLVLQRPYQLENGKRVMVDFRGGKSNALIVTVRGQAIITSRDRNKLIQSARWIFNLHQSLTPFYQLMAKTEGYQWVADQKSARLLASPTVWEDLTKTLLTTNTSWGNTRKMVEQLVALDPAGVFPSPQIITQYSEDDFSERVRAGYRSAYLYEVAQRVASGELHVESWRSLDSDSLYKAVTDLSGFGDYAAGTLMRTIGHFDKLAIDTVARKAYEQVTGQAPESDTDIRTYYERFGQWRGLVLWMDCIRDEADTVADTVAEA
ncbi:MAG: DNA-3-methyladenine glycosylase family protein [Anaerolineae bacterium]